MQCFFTFYKQHDLGQLVSFPMVWPQNQVDLSFQWTRFGGWIGFQCL